MINTDGARRNPPIATPMRFLTLYLPLIEYTALAMHCEDAQMRISRISRSLEHAIESGGGASPEAAVMPHVNEHSRDSISTESRRVGARLGQILRVPKVHASELTCLFFLFVLT